MKIFMESRHVGYLQERARCLHQFSFGFRHPYRGDIILQLKQISFRNSLQLFYNKIILVHQAVTSLFQIKHIPSVLTSKNKTKFMSRKEGCIVVVALILVLAIALEFANRYIKNLQLQVCTLSIRVRRSLMHVISSHKNPCSSEEFALGF